MCTSLESQESAFCGVQDLQPKQYQNNNDNNHKKKKKKKKKKK